MTGVYSNMLVLVQVNNILCVCVCSVKKVASNSSSVVLFAAFRIQMDRFTALTKNSNKRFVNIWLLLFAIMKNSSKGFGKGRLLLCSLKNKWVCHKLVFLKQRYFPLAAAAARKISCLCYDRHVMCFTCI